jgi:excinuclease ABC subunit A
MPPIPVWSHPEESSLCFGPEGGVRGGSVVVACPPEALAAWPDSHTGAALKPVLARGG